MLKKSPHKSSSFRHESNLKKVIFFSSYVLGYLLNSTIYKIGWSPYKANNQQQRTPSMILVLHPIVNNDEVYACNLCIEGLDSEEDVKKHLKDKHDKVVEKDKEVSSSDMKLDIERLSFENEEHNKEEEETISIKENVTMTKDSFKECNLCDYKCRDEVTLKMQKH